MEHIYEESTESRSNLEVVALLTGLLRWANDNVNEQWRSEFEDGSALVYYDELRGEISRLLQVYRSMTFPDDVTLIKTQAMHTDEDFEDYRLQIKGLKNQVEVAIPFYEIAMDAWRSRDFNEYDRAVYETAMESLQILRGA